MLKLLVVEDNPVDQLLVRRALAGDTSLQVELMVASRLSEALRFLGEHRFDLVLLDLGMIESDGLETYRRVRAVNRQVPMIVLTGLDDEVLGEQAVREGAQDYLVKSEIGTKLLVRAVRYAVDRCNLEAKLRQSQRLEAIGQLAGGIAHDFNNLLSVILGNVCALQEGLSQADEAESLSEIQFATERAASLTRQLLTFSRRQVLTPQQLDLNEQVERVSRMLRRLLAQTISLELSLTSEPTVLEADPGMLDQVLMNLALNARDAMPDGGKLEIGTARVRDCLRLTVSDTGGGIAPENQGRIFEPFFTTKEVGKGTGLGLATVYSIVEQHRGWIEVDSQLGKGTCISVFLPFEPQDAFSKEPNGRR